MLYGNLARGLTKACPPCSAELRSPFPNWLNKRMWVVHQRCTNQKNPSYPNYGGRGIRFGWDTVHDASMWVWQNLGPFEQRLTLDRIDTNGNYEPGNLRLADTRLQNGNKNLTVLSEFHQEHWPFSYDTTIKYLKRGFTREQMIEAAKEIVRTKGSHYNHVAEKLASMTSDLPDHITVLPYRGA